MNRQRFRSILALVTALALITGCGASGTGTQENKPAESASVEAASTVEPAKPQEEEKTADAEGQVSPEAETPDAADTDASQEEQQEEQPAEESQDPLWYGDVPAVEIPKNEALDFTAKLGAGYNLGNTFDAYNDTGIAADLSNELTTETYWQPVETTQKTIQGIADAGFKAIRIPVSWHNHVTGDVEISKAFLDRVNTVVDWALDAGLYVIINIHHDNHPEANAYSPDKAHREQSLHYVTRIWQQVAERFKDYDERLIFESLNEPRLVGNESEWWFSINFPPDDVKESIEIINELNQAFVDTVRSVEGKHRNCYLMCPGYDASPDGALVEGFRLPTDAADIDNRIILAVHAYTPYNFALNESGTEHFNPKNTSDKNDINAFITRIYNAYVKEGIPVVIGEFGARDKNGNLQDRVDYIRYYTAAAWAHGIPCFIWDNGAFSGSGEIFGIYDRAKGEAVYPDIIGAIVTNAVRRE
ncbi:MAG: glycoside hydrolase family 5 protein [Lachnospiraceae bacterium]|nr:glycoside hydrolase family 5 protein [Lachnospiraceae bacterium]